MKNDPIRDEQLNDLKEILKSGAGRRLIWRLLEIAGAFRLSFVQGDATATAFNEGMRNVGILVMSDVLEACPDRYLQMQREATKRNKELEDARNND